MTFRVQSQIGEIWRRHDQDVVGAISARFGPARPLMANVEHDAAHRRAQRIEDRFEGVGAEIVDPLQRRRRRQQTQMVGAFRQQAVMKAVSTRSGRHRVRDVLRRFLIIVEAGGAEGEVEIGHDGSSARSRAIAQATLCAMVDAADAALGPDHCDDAADRLGLGAENRPQIARTTSMVPTGAIT